MNCKLSIIIPVYNEINTIKEIIRRVMAVPYEKEVIIIDDGSNDGTKEYLQRYSSDNSIKLISLEKNHGKGYAVRQGLKRIEGDIVIFQDADLEYFPEEYSILIEDIVAGKADAVYGSRFIGRHRVFLFYHLLGNKILNFFTNIIYDTTLTDLMTCYKAFKIEVIRSLNLKSNDFDIEAEVTGELLKKRYVLYEVPISYNGRTYDEGKKIRYWHFFKCLWRIIETKFRPLNIQDDALFKLNYAANYNRWIVEKIKPFIGSAVLEIGAGIGVFGNYLLSRNRKLIFLEINHRYISFLKKRFGYNSNVEIVEADITAENIQADLKKYNLDTIICINVLEHIRDDRMLLEKMFEVLKHKGRLILLVPSHPILYGKIDKKFGHYRRYSKENLITLIEQCGFVVENIGYHNRLSALGWYFNYRIMRNKNFPSSLSLYVFDNFIIPTYKYFDNIFNLPFGLSLVAICRKDKR